ncbi:MAG: phytoene synthase [Bacteroidetes bacterium HGW-Bacteroidetes-20]|nr:MAG: phytoene synthase [Bacteroidetes bacterium HGW-Bacteroidetes-20]
MDKITLYNDTTAQISRIVTKKYSTSFYWSSLFFSKEIRKEIFNIYGFVRFADEIVDSFHNYDKKRLLDRFIQEFEYALVERISLNPIIHSFVETVSKNNIDKKHIDAFLESMRFDLTKSDYQTDAEIQKYIYGSAEVIGLMCLKVFCKGDQSYYETLEPGAIKLGAAFQKVNFLRDIQNDTLELNRNYFPNIVHSTFNEDTKNEIVKDIENDFAIAKESIKKLPKGSKLAVLIAFEYYHSLLKRIKNEKVEVILTSRVRVPNYWKLFLIFKAVILRPFYN